MSLKNRIGISTNLFLEEENIIGIIEFLSEKFKNVHLEYLGYQPFC